VRKAEFDGTWSVVNVLRILMEPAAYFEDVASSTGLANPTAFVMVHAAILAAAAYVAHAAAAVPLEWKAASYEVTASLVAGAALWAAAAALAALVVSHGTAAALHPLLLLSGGDGGYRGTYAGVVYGSVPLTLLATAGYVVERTMPEYGLMAAWLSVAGALWFVGTCAVGLTRLHRLEGLGTVVGVAAPLLLVTLGLLMIRHVQTAGSAAETGPVRYARVTIGRVIGGPEAKPGSGRTASGMHHRAQDRSRAAR